MKIGLVGPSYEMRSLPFDAQRSVNLFPVFDEQGKEVAAMYSVPGKSQFANVGTGPIRGAFSSYNGRAFAISGSSLYEVLSDGNGSSLGSLDQSSGVVTIAENGTQLAICDGVSVYILTYSTNAFAKVTDVDLPSSGTITFIDGYFVVNQNSSGRFYISALNDGTSWAALDFATAQNSPDALKAVYNGLGQLWLFGDFTTEVWSNTGASNFPFRRVSSGVMEQGVASPYTIVEVDNSLIFLGQDKFGRGVVYKTQGFSPARISTVAIEKRIQEASNLQNARAFVYQQEGAVFYVLTGGGLETSLVYDLTTQQWHERAYINDDGNFEQDLGCCHMYAFNRHLVGSRIDGRIYELDLDVYADGDQELVRERVYTHLSDEGARIRYNALEIGFETGVGLQSGQGSAPVVSLALSKDGARTWIDCGTRSLGAAGEYETKVEFRRLGVAEQMTFKIRVSDPVKVAITGSYLR